MWYGVAGRNGGWDVTSMVPLFITSDSVLTYSPLPEPAPFPQPWVGSRTHPLDCALPSSTLVPAFEGCLLCCECCYGLGFGMGVRGGGLVVRRPLAGQPRLAASSGALAREPLRRVWAH